MRERGCIVEETRVDVPPLKCIHLFQPPKGQGKRNETQSQVQELQEDDDYDYDDDDGGPGGSLQQLVELLPLVLPILQDLSDSLETSMTQRLFPENYTSPFQKHSPPPFSPPTQASLRFQPNTETDVAELLQAAIPLVQGLSEGDGEEEPPDFAGIFVPILLNIIGGPDGQGSDPNAILGPLIQLLAPFIGPIIGPLIGPLSQQSSNTPQEGGSSFSTLVQAIVGPLSQPTGPGYMSPFSTLIAGVVASLSKELTNGQGGLDLSSLVKAVVSGFLAGTSAGLSKNKDTAMAPTSYGGYGGYGGYGPIPASGINPLTLISSSIKDILSAGLKVASSLITALAGILGASSQPSPQPYGPPPSYGSPTASSYTNGVRPPPRNTRFTKF
ncbi:hypothetical protein KM043_005779 [Ampulex compressa]|nr:hypothetical protein KM043_005779 [Ampulex compressa]